MTWKTGILIYIRAITEGFSEVGRRKEECDWGFAVGTEKVAYELSQCGDTQKNIYLVILTMGKRPANITESHTY
jgi:hypothetical protein